MKIMGEAISERKLKDATQVAYLNFVEKTIQKRIDNKKSGPFILRDLIKDNINTEKLNERLNNTIDELKNVVEKIFASNEISEANKERLKNAKLLKNDNLNEEERSSAIKELGKIIKEISDSDKISEANKKEFKSAMNSVILENNAIKNKPLAELLEYCDDMIQSDKDILLKLSDEALNWKIADIHDRNRENGFYGCVIEIDDKIFVLDCGLKYATDNEYGLTKSGQPDKELIKEGYSLCRRNALVIDVASKYNGIRLLGLCYVKNLIEDEPLFIKHAVFIDSLTYMQVTCV